MIIPDSFEAKQAKLHHGCAMKFKVNGHKFAAIKWTTINNERQFQLINAHEHLIAIARSSPCDQGTAYSVYDESNNLIGLIQRKQVQEEQHIAQMIVIGNGKGELIGQGQQTSNQSINICDALNVKMSRVTGEKGKLASKWDVHLLGSFDRRIFMFLPIVLRPEQALK